MTVSDQDSNTNGGSARSAGVEETTWQNVPLSGVTVVLGAGTGTVVQMLSEQIAAGQGQLVVVDFAPRHLKPLTPLLQDGRVSLVRGRARQLPLLERSADLIAVNGLLREVPESRLPIFFEELWRVLVPGGQTRISDVLAPSEEPHHRAWQQRNRIIHKLGKVLGMPTAVAADLTTAARAMRGTGFEDLSVSLLPGAPLSDAWLEETVNAVRSMSSRSADMEMVDELLNTDLPRLVAAHAEGEQMAADRFVLGGIKSFMA
jgi:SAM-dependent methyltransferase